MATNIEVLSFLRPNGGYVQVGESYDGITFEPQCEPFSEAEYKAGFAQFDAWKAEQVKQTEAKRQAALSKLEALGLDEDDLKALGF